MFLSEEGVECVTANQNNIVTCVKKAVPEIFGPVSRRNKNEDRLHFYVFQQENCRFVHWKFDQCND